MRLFDTVKKQSNGLPSNPAMVAFNPAFLVYIYCIKQANIAKIK